MDLGTLIPAIVGSGGFFALIQFLIGRYDSRNGKLNRIERKIDTAIDKCGRNELATTRLQLLFLIQMETKNKDAILQTAQRYFMELDGNGEAWDAFKHWADTMEVDLGYYNAHMAKKGR